MQSIPKYSILEIERRWLVNPNKIGNLEQEPFRKIEDLYITGTRLRLRLVEDKYGKIIYKLGKKYGKHSKIVEPITTLYLSPSEYEALSILPGKKAKKEKVWNR